MEPQNIQTTNGQSPSYQPAGYSNKKPKVVTIILVTLSILVVAYLVYAYFFNSWPFAISNPSDLFSKSFYNLFKINTTSYEVKVGIKAQDREQDAEKLSAELLEYTTPKQPMYDRDNDRIRDISIVRNSLGMFFNKNKNYPVKMATAGITIANDPSGNPYIYQATNGQQNFNFTVEFETSEIVETLNNKYWSSPPKINGKKITFDKDSIYHVSNYSTLKPKLPGFVNVISSLNSLILYLPSDTNVNLDVKGIAQSQTEKVPDTSLSANLDADFSDMSYKAGAELLKKDENIYFKLNAFPNLFFGAYLDKIKQKWIQITPDDLSAYGVQDLAEKDNNFKQQVLEQLKSLFSLALSDNALLGYDKATTERINGKAYYKYTLSLNKDKLQNFYKDLTDQFAKQFGDKALIKFDQVTYDYMQSPAYDKLYDYISKNIKFYYYVDPRSQYPFMFEYVIRLVPDSAASKYGGLFGSKAASDKEFIATIDLSLTDVNKAIKIEAPKDFMTFMDLQISMTGQSKEQYLMQKQTQNISSIKTALNYYYLIAGVYPKSLDELTKMSKEITFVKNPKLNDRYKTYGFGDLENIKKRFESTPLLKVIPKDAFDGQEYKYVPTSTSEDYSLVFNINLPPYEKGKAPSFSVYKTYSSLDKVTNKYESFFDLAYKNGINTVTASSFDYTYSNTKPAGSIDNDGDRISDDFEVYLGTDPNKKDTDGDGVSDGEEFKLGSNPLGAGKLAPSSSY